MYYPLLHSWDILERGKSDADCTVFSRHLVSLHFWWLSLANVSRSEFQKWDFLNIYILSLPPSPLLIQWTWVFYLLFVCSFLLFFLPCRILHFSNSSQVVSILDSCPNVGTQFYFQTFFSLKTRKTKTKAMPVSLTYTHTPKNESQNQQARRKPLGFIFDFFFLIRQNAGLGPDFLLQFKKYISKDIIWSVWDSDFPAVENQLSSHCEETPRDYRESKTCPYLWGSLWKPCNKFL